MKWFNLTFLVIALSFCQGGARSQNQASTPCYALYNPDGSFKQLACDGKPVEVPKGEKGDPGIQGAKGDKGDRGEKGDPGSGGLAVKSVKVCRFNFPEAGLVKMEYTLTTYSDDTREPMFYIEDEEGIFVNTARYPIGSTGYSEAPLDLQAYAVKLTSATQASVKHRPSSRNFSFPCNTQ